MSKVFKLLGLVVLVLLAVAAYRLLGTVVEPKVEHRIGEIGLTPNEIAANGPLPGDVSQYAKELACAQNLSTPGYYPSINGAELTDLGERGLVKGLDNERTLGASARARSPPRWPSRAIWPRAPTC